MSAKRFLSASVFAIRPRMSNSMMLMAVPCGSQDGWPTLARAGR
jgi:hypothetical protein